MIQDPARVTAPAALRRAITIGHAGLGRLIEASSAESTIGAPHAMANRNGLPRGDHHAFLVCGHKAQGVALFPSLRLKGDGRWGHRAGV